MAQRVITLLVSDLSGDEMEAGNGETIEFSYRGRSYTIDLTDKEAKGFDKSIAMYLEHATQTAGRTGSRRPTPATTRRSKEELANIRSWWRSQGNQIGDRGRVPQKIIDAYHDAH